MFNGSDGDGSGEVLRSGQKLLTSGHLTSIPRDGNGNAINYLYRVYATVKRRYDGILRLLRLISLW